jgi:hypothetical protein
LAEGDPLEINFALGAGKWDSFPATTMTSELIELLRRRVAIIADHDWRDRDAAGHLAALKEVSEKISAWTLTHRPEVDAQLRHYLANASYQKALAHLEALKEG